jgi:fumarate reductase (CoM/CoB) subunit B
VSRPKEEKAEVTVFRFDPLKNKEPRYEQYHVPFDEHDSILNALVYIAEHFDDTLSFRFSCRTGQCIGCVNRVNGKPVRICRAPMQRKMVIEPAIPEAVLRDLVTSK